MCNAKRGISLLLALVALAGLSACGGGDDTSGGSGTATTRQDASGGGQAMLETIVVRSGEPVGGVAELEYDAGEEVRFRVSSDVADEVHVHGYDISKDVPAGGSVRFSFPARLEGVFEVELEGRHEQIAELRVNP